MTFLVVGAARSGVALAQHLTRYGGRVIVVDRKPESELHESIAQMPEHGVEFQLGGYDESVLDGISIVFASPGVPWDSEFLNAARARGIPISSEMEQFLELSAGIHVGITGTNGKTTTTALVGEVLKAGGLDVVVGGNIGDTVLDRVHDIGPATWVVLELSSFQLESVEKPRFHVGVILNITPDHLDRHGTLERYVDLKARARFDQHQPPPPMPLPGRHNLENGLAAAAVGRIAGLSDDVINEAIRGFKGVEHRLELVGEWAGVRWYNDSKATNPDAGRVALSSFPGTPLILIAGGYGGGFDLHEWVADVLAHTEAVILIGASAGQLAQELRAHPRVVRAGSLEEAVSIAAGQARDGSVVLLSPAYKSFDMFKDFEDRGNRFKALVRQRFAA